MFNQVSTSKNHSWNLNQVKHHWNPKSPPAKFTCGICPWDFSSTNKTQLAAGGGFFGEQFKAPCHQGEL